MSYQILSMIVPFITTPYVSRVLGPAGVGEYSYAGSIVSYFVLVASLGIATFGQREIAYSQDNVLERSRAFWEAVILKSFTSLSALAAYIGFLIITNETRIVFYILSLNIISNLFDISWLFQGLEDFQKIVIRNTAFKFINIAYIFCFVKVKEDLPWYVLGICGFSLLNTISLWISVPKYIIFVKELHPFHNIKTILELFVPTIAFQVYAVLDKTMIGLAASSAVENGYYEQAEKIVLMVKMLLTSMSTVMLPRMANLLKSDKYEQAKRYLSKTCGFDWLLGLPLVFGILVCSNYFVPLFLGDGFDKSILIMNILSPIIVLTSISGVIGYQYLIASGRQNIYTKTVFISSGLNLLFNSIFIPKFLATGAAIGSILAEIINFTILVAYMQRRGILSITDIFKYAYKPFISSLIMSFVLILVKGKLPLNWKSLFFMVIIGGLIYALSLAVMRDELFSDNLQIIAQKIRMHRLKNR